MREENNEIIEEKIEEVEKEVVEEKPKNKKKSNIIIPILAAVLAFVIVYGGITLVNYLGAKDEVVEKDDNANKDEDVNIEDNSNDENNSDGSIGTTGPDEVITITDDMKAELNKIANIGDGYCYVEKLFYNMNGFTKDLTLENKRYIIMSYYVLENFGSDRISESAFNKIAAKYNFTDGFDTIMAGLEKVNGEYVIPPMGCVSPERVTHNTTYQDTGNTITVVDNVTITNTETQASSLVKVIYTFVYSKDGDNITFYLTQVNSER